MVIAIPNDLESTELAANRALANKLGQRVASVIQINYDINQNANFGW